MNIYDEANELLEPIDLTLDMMKKFIQPTIFKGLKSNIESIKHTIKKHEERAKKVEELLGLYKEIYIVTFYLFGETDPDLGQELMNKHDELHNLIKTLEEELK